MYLIHGVYRWKKQRTAYRGDYCLSCECPRIAELYRSFNVGHLYFIPLLPLGYRDHWHCTACGHDPHVRVRTSKALIVLFVVVLGLLTGLAWVAAPLIPTTDVSMVWGMRLVPMALMAASIIWLKKQPAIPGLKERLATVPPVPMDHCLYCRGGLDRDGYCAPCNIRRTQLDSRFSLMR